jgi:hypothetical protein
MKEPRSCGAPSAGWVPRQTLERRSRSRLRSGPRPRMPLRRVLASCHMTTWSEQTATFPSPSDPIAARNATQGVVTTCVGPDEGGSDPTPPQERSPRGPGATSAITPAGKGQSFGTNPEGRGRRIRSAPNPPPPGLGPRGPRHPQLLPRTRRSPRRGVEWEHAARGWLRCRYRNPARLLP